MNGPEVLIPITFFLTIGAIFISRSRIGEAIADRIRGDSLAGAEVRQELDQLRQELDAVRHELLETQERMDFAERLLARPAEGGVAAARRAETGE